MRAKKFVADKEVFINDELNKDYWNRDNVMEDHLKELKLKLQKGHESTTLNSTENPLLSQKLVEASKNGNIDTVKTNLDNGADVNSLYTLRGKYFKYTALLMAAKNGYLDITKYLITNGADVNYQIKIWPDQIGETALILAAGNGHYEIVKHLIVKGAHMGKASANGETAIDKAQ